MMKRTALVVAAAVAACRDDSTAGAPGDTAHPRPRIVLPGDADTWYLATRPCPARAVLVDVELHDGRHVECVTVGSPFVQHGRSTTFFGPHAPRSSGWYRDGKLDGEWTDWHPSGEVATRREWRRGKQVGTWQVWDEAGAPLATFAFVDGTGVEQEWQDGRMVATRAFRDGIPTGEWRQILDDGTSRVSATFDDGGYGTEILLLPDGGQRQSGWGYLGVQRVMTFDASGTMTSFEQWYDGRMLSRRGDGPELRDQDVRMDAVRTALARGPAVP